ncbi:MAG TPA: endonuclease, partial [Porphyromonadaceae bacterium]|nr:endonuclease [Porphyromonadaceae bacterium]
LRYWKAEVFNRSFLIQQEGRNRGYPHRTFSNNTFIDGYSDHLPVLVYLIREQQ